MGLLESLLLGDPQQQQEFQGFVQRCQQFGRYRQQQAQMQGMPLPGFGQGVS